MAEIAPAGGGPNRLFIVLAIGLAALLVIGLIGLGGILFIQNASRSAVVSPTIRIAAATATRPAPTVEVATAAPTAVATPTLVLSGSGGVPVAQTGATSTPAPTPAPNTTTGELPQTGLGENLLLLAGGIVLVMIIFVARRVRTA